MSLAFVFSCGPRRDPYSSFVRIDGVELIGCEKVEEKDIIPYLYSGAGDLYSPFSSPKNAKSILSYYFQMGYFKAKILNQTDSMTQKGYVLKYVIEEGERSYINSVSIYGFDSFADLSSFKDHDILPGQPLNQVNLSLALLKTASDYIRRGYYNVRIEDTLLPATQDSLLCDVLIYIDTGPKVYIDEIEILGNSSVRTKIIEMESDLEVGQLYTPELLTRSRNNLYYTGLFSYVSVKSIPSKIHSDSLKVIIMVEETKMSYFLVSLNYKSDKKTGIRVRWGNYNLFGNAQRISVTASYNTDFQGIYTENAEISYSEPYFLGTSLIFSSDLKGERKGLGDRSLDYIEFSPLLGKRTSAFGILYAGFVFHKAWLDTFEDASQNPNQFIYTKFTNSIIMGYTYDSRDNPFSPTRGLKQNFRFQSAGRPLGGDNYFYRFSWDWVRLSEPSQWGYYVFLRSVYTIPHGISIDNGISSDQKITLGGVNSLRGYPENSIGDPDEIGSHSGNILLNAMIQAHYNIGDFSLEAFSDLGGLWDCPKDVSPYENVGISVGLGLIYNTPAGPLRIEFGLPLAGEQRNKGLIQFAFGNPF
ncbi:BamA/TamA family outer membrane protein [candidate division WOR-3 bacterium]|nr:BamA/TamA family outer membrane protein [candidate division WOR-3 bacterium]